MRVDAILSLISLLVFISCNSQDFTKIDGEGSGSNSNREVIVTDGELSVNIGDNTSSNCTDCNTDGKVDVKDEEYIANNEKYSSDDGTSLGEKKKHSAEEDYEALEENKDDILNESHCTKVYGNDRNKLACFNGNSSQATFLVCHVPPGNPSRAHVIEVGLGALRSHVTHHHDYLLDCNTDIYTQYKHLFLTNGFVSCNPCFTDNGEDSMHSCSGDDDHC